MKIVIPGGSGQVGTMLARAFLADGHDVVVLSRTPGSAPWRVVKWDGETLGPWIGELEGADVAINLAGRSVNCRYGPANRKLMIDSRVKSTMVVGKAIAKCARAPRLWLQASTATIYAHRYDAPNDELTGIIGGNEPNASDTWRFSIEVARAWEEAANQAQVPQTRKVLLRSAMTMSPDPGGIFAVLLGLVGRGLGGKAGNGRQFISWIHARDFVRALYFLMEHEELSGPVNICSPHPLPNAQFMRILRKAWGRRLGLPAARWMLAAGAFFMRTETELVLKSRRVVPTRLLNAGFQFEFADWESAARDLCASWRQSARR